MFECICELLEIGSKWDSVIQLLGLQKQRRRDFFLLRFNSTKKLSVRNILIESLLNGALLSTKCIICPPYSFLSYIHLETTDYQEKRNVFLILLSLIFPMI